MIINSGKSDLADTDREYVGMGFNITSWLHHAVVRLTPQKNRLASLQLRIKHGRILEIFAYAPHNRRLFEGRYDFFKGLH